MAEKLSIKERMSELEDVLAAVECQYEAFIDDMCQIIFEGESTDVGTERIISRIKEHCNYDKWLSDSKGLS